MFYNYLQVVSDGWRTESRLVHGENYNYELISFQHKCNACQRAKGIAKGDGKGKGKGRGVDRSRPEVDEDGEADPDGEGG